MESIRLDKLIIDEQNCPDSQFQISKTLDNLPPLDEAVIKSSHNYFSLIESSLKETKTKNKNLTLNVIKLLTELNGKENFVELMKYKLKEKKLIFVRHCQAEHNYYNIYLRSQKEVTPNYYDPNLTEEGLEQSKDIQKFISELDFSVEVVFTSPLRRTLQTLHAIKETLDSKSGSKINYIATELIREEVANPQTHFGHKLSQMREVFKEMHFVNMDYIKKEIWWSYEEDDNYFHFTNKNDENFIPERKGEFRQRLILFLLWFIFAEEKNGCLISHSKVYKLLNNTPKGEKAAKHGGYYILDNNKLFAFIEDFLKNNLNNSNAKSKESKIKQGKKNKKGKIISEDEMFESALKSEFNK